MIDTDSSLTTLKELILRLRPSSQPIYGRGFPIQWEPELGDSTFDGQLRLACSITRLILERSSRGYDELSDPIGIESQNLSILNPQEQRSSASPRSSSRLLWNLTMDIVSSSQPRRATLGTSRATFGMAAKLLPPKWRDPPFQRQPCRHRGLSGY